MAEAPTAGVGIAPVVVIGAGPAGMKLVREIRRQAPDEPILIFGEERWAPYNRVLLTPLFAGETPVSDIYLPWSPAAEPSHVRLMHRRIVSIDPQSRTGEDAEVGAYIAADPAFPPFFQGLGDMLLGLLPHYEREGKRYLTVAVGCTGGRHRSVFVACKLAQLLTDEGYRNSLRHRDKDKPSE